MRVALIGHGRWGALIAKAFNACGADVWMFDCDGSRGSPLSELWARPRTFDAAIVTTPADVHFWPALRAIEAGLQVLVSKPLTTNGVEARTLRRAADTAGVTLMCDLTFLYDAAYAVAHAYLSDLGPIIRIDSTRANCWGVGNVVWDLLPHDLAVWSWWLKGQPDSLRIETGVASPTAHAFARYGAVECHAYMSHDEMKKRRRVLIVGERGKIVIDDARVFMQLGGGEVVELAVPADEALVTEARHFIAACAGEAKPLGDPVAIVEQIEAALGQRRAEVAA